MLVHEKKLEGIKGLRDESTDDVRVVIDVKPSAHPQNILNFVYKHTQLEETFHFNMVAIVDGVPQTLSLKAALEEFVRHRHEIVTRRTKFELAKAEAREHILIGLKIALDHIDEVIKTIRASKDALTAKLALIKRFKLSELQAVAILEMRLQKLAGLERLKIEEELKAIQAVIKDLKELLASTVRMKNLIKKEMLEVAEKHGDDRKTKVMKNGVKNVSSEDLIPDEDSVLVLTKGGYVKRTNPNEYKQQKRGGVGVVDLDTKDEDFVKMFLHTTTHADLLFFTNFGKVYKIKMYEIPEGRRATKGKSIMNFISLSADEEVTSVIPMSKDLKSSKDLSVMMTTRSGIAKKVDAKSFHDVRRSGIIAITLAKDDRLVDANFVDKGDEVILVSSEGQSIRFKESDVRQMGRTAAGVKCLTIKAKDFVIASGVINKNSTAKTLLVFSEQGYGKQTDLKEYKVQKRGGSGIKTAKVTDKIGKLISACVITDELEEIVTISKKSQVVRVDLKEVPNLGRQTQGVKIMKLRAGDSIASCVCF
jgi:DNA gyrase subunit A